MRNIKLHIDADHMESAMAITTPEKFEAMLSRLALWAIHRYDTVTVYPDGDCKDPTDFVAVYTDTVHGDRFVIGAVWHDDHYGFHS